MGRDRAAAKHVMMLMGTRPEAVKTAPLALLLCRDSRFTATAVDTGQQPGRVHEALAPFGLAADITLRLDRPTGTLSELAAALITKIDALLARERPATVVVQGDTTTVLVGGLVAFWHRIPVVHLEAGLRTWDVDQPFPEEANRSMLARFAALHLAPTPAARQNLLDEGVRPGTVVVTGNTVVDALHTLVDNGLATPPAEVTAMRGPIVVATMHRRENWGDGIRDSLEGLRRIARMRPDVHIVAVAHPNPRLREEMSAQLTGTPNATLIPPLPYPKMIGLLRAARLVITDSGGLQEEAATLGVPLLVTRNTTERPEAVESGHGQLVGTDPRQITRAALTLLSRPTTPTRPSPFGDGRAAEHALAAIATLLELPSRDQMTSRTKARTTPHQVSTAARPTAPHNFIC
ncbi:non-hydrolyzing UDP-N-acetylglucosamine 2-epimerase [Micromonospora sp. NPDC002575]|uniref:non-hydrolyzing UDP-N-acetylglucosamine 2-epimerase n=1 Tax=Micromonospora sp. NPDC002575 TaxID=3364222 RepID=UPI003676A419